HDAGAAARHPEGEGELEPAQGGRAREQEVPLREDQLLAQVDDRQLLPVGEHRLQGERQQRLREAGRRQRVRGYVACCGVICSTLPEARSKRTRSMLSRLVPVTRMKRAPSG